jgi:hypothetical protein
MKIVQLLSGFPTAITNEEQEFVRRHPTEVTITSLDEHNQVVAQNLVRKGIYSISKDDRRLINNCHEKNT